MTFKVKIDESTKKWLVTYVSYVIQRLKGLSITIKIKENEVRESE